MEIDGILNRCFFPYGRTICAISIKSPPFGACSSREATREVTFIFTRWDQTVFLLGQGDLVVLVQHGRGERWREVVHVGSCLDQGNIFNRTKPLFYLASCFRIPCMRYDDKVGELFVLRLLHCWLSHSRFRFKILSQCYVYDSLAHPWKRNHVILDVINSIKIPSFHYFYFYFWKRVIEIQTQMFMYLYNFHIWRIRRFL